MTATALPALGEAACPPSGPVPVGGGKQPFDRHTALYSYVIVRTDLSAQQQTVQAIHAAMAATAHHGGLTDDTRLALLAARDQRQLYDIADALEREGIAFSLFEEPDHGIGASALATAPGPFARFRCLKRLPLWGAVA